MPIHGDLMLADPIMVRLIYNVHKIELKGPSIRGRSAKTHGLDYPKAKRAKKVQTVLNKFNDIIKQINAFKNYSSPWFNLNRIGCSVATDYPVRFSIFQIIKIFCN